MYELAAWLSEKDSSNINIPRANATNTFSGVYDLVFAVVGGISLIILIIAGIRFITSQGDPNATAKARNTIIYAAIGLAVSISAFTIVKFVIDKL